jgi:hypothetical protein
MLCFSQSPIDRGLASIFCQFDWPIGSSVQAAIDQLEDQANVVDEPADTVMLENAASNPEQIAVWKNLPRVRIEGFYNPISSSERGTFFSVVRLRVACCLNDARPSMVLAMAKKPPAVKPGDWVTVLGRVDFYPDKGGHKPAMKVAQVKATKMPANPYLK